MALSKFNYVSTWKLVAAEVNQVAVVADLILGYVVKYNKEDQEDIIKSPETIFIINKSSGFKNIHVVKRFDWLMHLQCLINISIPALYQRCRRNNCFVYYSENHMKFVLSRFGEQVEDSKLIIVEQEGIDDYILLNEAGELNIIPFWVDSHFTESIDVIPVKSALTYYNQPHELPIIPTSPPALEEDDDTDMLMNF